jgi:hypothetical protein
MVIIQTYRVHHIKWNPTTIMYYSTKIKSHAGPPLCNALLASPVTLKPRLPLKLSHCSHQLCKSRAGANMVYSREECVFILKYYFVPKSFAAVCEAFSNVYPDKEALNRTIYQLVTKFLVNACLREGGGHFQNIL